MLFTVHLPHLQTFASESLPPSGVFPLDLESKWCVYPEARIEWKTWNFQSQEPSDTWVTILFFFSCNMAIATDFWKIWQVHASNTTDGSVQRRKFRWFAGCSNCFIRHPATSTKYRPDRWELSGGFCFKNGWWRDKRLEGVTCFL